MASAFSNKLAMLNNYKKYLISEQEQQRNSQMFRTEQRKLFKVTQQKQSKIENIIEDEKNKLIDQLDNEIIQKTYKARSLSVKKVINKQSELNDDSLYRATTGTLEKSFQTIKKNDSNHQSGSNYTTIKQLLTPVQNKRKTAKQTCRKQQNQKTDSRRWRQRKSNKTCQKCLKYEKLIEKLKFNDDLLSQQELTLDLIMDQFNKTCRYAQDISTNFEQYKLKVQQSLKSHLQNIEKALENQNILENLYANNSKLKMERDYFLNIVKQ